MRQRSILLYNHVEETIYNYIYCPNFRTNELKSLDCIIHWWYNNNIYIVYMYHALQGIYVYVPRRNVAIFSRGRRPRENIATFLREHIHIYPAEHDKYSIHIIFEGSYNSHGNIFVYTTQLSRECMHIFPLKMICI